MPDEAAIRAAVPSRDAVATLALQAAWARVDRARRDRLRAPAGDPRAVWPRLAASVGVVVCLWLF